jgi:hypothetical protein
VDRIPELTHNQSYLLQAIGSELVNQLSTRNRITAAMGDLIIAVEKTPVSAQAYFHYAWANECSDEERGVLRNWRSALILGRISAGRASDSVTQRDCRKGSERLSFERQDVWFLDSEKRRRER